MASSDSRYASPAGYTLVELLTVLGIIAVICAMGWPWTAGMLEQADLLAATQTVITSPHAIYSATRIHHRRGNWSTTTKRYFSEQHMDRFACRS